MPEAAAIETLGLRELIRDLRRAAPAVRAEVRDAVREATRIVAIEAMSIATSEGLTFKRTDDAGRENQTLISGIRPGIRGGGAVGVVREIAVRTKGANAPYPYPRIYEYGDRPFLQPAVDRKRDEVEAMLLSGVERALESANL